MSLESRLRRINAYRMVIEHLWKLADAEAPRVSAIMKRLAVEHGRIFLGLIAEAGSLRRRLAIYAELRKSGFLARLFRETGQNQHLKRIVRAYLYGLVGSLAGPSPLTEEGGGQRPVTSDK